MSSTSVSLNHLFRSCYGSVNLLQTSALSFHSHIESLLGSIDASGEGYFDSAKQRDLSIKYHWGHDHDFGGGVRYQGRMGLRHIEVIADFVDHFGLPVDLSGKKILDIGVWTGGSSLLLVAMGAEVIALEEVIKYSDTVNFLAKAFGVQDRLRCMPRSLFEVLPMLADTFDYAIYSGVVYHVSDPLLSLRLVFASLKDRGVAFVETAGWNSTETVCRYEGPTLFHSGSAEESSRGGWNYFVPSPSCLAAWCKDAGFQSVLIGDVDESQRLKGSCLRAGFQDFCRAGMSNPFTR